MPWSNDIPEYFAYTFHYDYISTWWFYNSINYLEFSSHGIYINMWLNSNE